MNRTYILTVTICGLLMLTGAGLLAWGVSASGLTVVSSFDGEQYMKGEN